MPVNWQPRIDLAGPTGLAGPDGTIQAEANNSLRAAELMRQLQGSGGNGSAGSLFSASGQPRGGGGYAASQSGSSNVNPRGAMFQERPAGSGTTPEDLIGRLMTVYGYMGSDMPKGRFNADFTAFERDPKEEAAWVERNQLRRREIDAIQQKQSALGLRKGEADVTLAEVGVERERGEIDAMKREQEALIAAGMREAADRKEIEIARAEAKLAETNRQAQEDKYSFEESLRKNELHAKELETEQIKQDAALDTEKRALALRAAKAEMVSKSAKAGFVAKQVAQSAKTITAQLEQNSEIIRTITTAIARIDPEENPDGLKALRADLETFKNLRTTLEQGLEEVESGEAYKKAVSEAEAEMAMAQAAAESTLGGMFPGDQPAQPEVAPAPGVEPGAASAPDPQQQQAAFQAIQSRSPTLARRLLEADQSGNLQSYIQLILPRLQPADAQAVMALIGQVGG